MKRRNKSRNAAFPKPNRSALFRFFETVYPVLYVVGIRTLRCVKAVVRFTRSLWRPVAHGLHRAAEWLLLRHWRAARTEGARIAQGFRLAGDRVHATTAEKASTRFLQVLNLFRLAVRRHEKVVKGIANAVAIAAALILLVGTVSYWQQAKYALALEYGGQTIGYIATEETYAQAAVLVKASVINADGSFSMEMAPQMTVSVMSDEELLAKQEVCARILDVESDSLVSLAGLYVDGVFQGAVDDRSSLQALVDEVLVPYESEDYDGVDFFDEVEIVEGLYPATVRTQEENLRSYLKTLPVKTITNITYTETVKYSTIRVEDTSQPLGYESVSTKGVNGKRKVNAQIIRVDGKEMYRTVVSADMITKPVDEVITVGAQTYSATSVIGDGKATGTFIWPLPYTKQISSPFASRWGSFHGAIDIANGSTYGKPIIASDGGTVVEAEYHSSYGYYVLIDPSAF